MITFYPYWSKIADNICKISDNSYRYATNLKLHPLF